MHLLINFNLTDNAWIPDPRGRPTARLICMARRSEWIGAADRFEPDQVDVAAGGMDARFGDNVFGWDGDRYIVRAGLRSGRIAVDLQLVPASVAVLAGNQALSDDRSIGWFVLPVLQAYGTAIVDGVTYPIDAAPAYHDHNWGEFLWGDDFCWEWASVLPGAEAEWGLVFGRVLDRPRHRTRSRALHLFHRGRSLRSFRDEEVVVRTDGRFVPAPGFLQIPPVMGALAGGTASDVPARLTIEAGAGRDRVQMVFEPRELARVVMPNETDIHGITTLNEVLGDAVVTGHAWGRDFRVEGPGVFEFIRG